MYIYICVEEAKIRKGVGRGCTLSPSYFNIYVQKAINKVREEIEVGIRINGERIDMLRFAEYLRINELNNEKRIQYENKQNKN